MINNVNRGKECKLVLHVLRHAKSSWADAPVNDFDRPLNDRGLEAASTIGRFCKKTNLSPTLILCSPALRTRMTWGIINRFLPVPRDVKFRRDIYEASVLSLLNVIRNVPNDEKEILLIGHNPGIQMLICSLIKQTRSQNQEIFNKIYQKFPTGALATLTLNTKTWAGLDESSAQLKTFITPKELTRT